MFGADTGQTKSGLDPLPFPLTVRRAIPMLQGATATPAEMAAWWVDSVRRYLPDLKKFACNAVGMADDRSSDDMLSGQNEGDEQLSWISCIAGAHSMVTDTVTASTNGFNHDFKRWSILSKSLQLCRGPAMAAAHGVHTGQPMLATAGHDAAPQPGRSPSGTAGPGRPYNTGSIAIGVSLEGAIQRNANIGRLFL